MNNRAISNLDLWTNLTNLSTLANRALQVSINERRLENRPGFPTTCQKDFDLESIEGGFSGNTGSWK